MIVTGHRAKMCVLYRYLQIWINPKVRVHTYIPPELNATKTWNYPKFATSCNCNMTKKEMIK